MKRRKWKAGTYARNCDRSDFRGNRSDMIVEPHTGLIVLKKFYVKENPIGLPWTPPREKPLRIE